MPRKMRFVNQIVDKFSDSDGVLSSVLLNSVIPASGYAQGNTLGEMERRGDEGEYRSPQAVCEAVETGC